MNFDLEPWPLIVSLQCSTTQWVKIHFEKTKLFLSSYYVYFFKARINQLRLACFLPCFACRKSSLHCIGMCFERFLLAFESRDLSQADKSIIRVSSFPCFNFWIIDYSYTQKTIWHVLVNLIIQKFASLKK